MFRYRDLSIQHKISVVIIVGMTSAILVAVVNFISFDHLRVKQSLLAEMQVLAKITAARSAAGVMFDLDVNAIRDLEALELRDTIQKACMYRKTDELHHSNKNELFASYYRGENTYGPCAETMTLLDHGYHFGDALTVQNEIVYNGTVRGYIAITSDLTTLARRKRDWLYTGVLVTVAGLIVAFLMTRRMQRAIVHPIVNLADVMDDIKQNNDLTLRAKYSGEDEVGTLVASFNNMLDIIHRNNVDLDQLYEGLVEKSAEAEATAASLEVSNNHIKDIFGSAAHDLRQPLQAMSIFADTLLHSVRREEQKDIVRKLKQAMSNLNDLFSEILDVSRYDFDLNIVGTKPTPIVPLLSKVSLEFEAMAEAKGLRFKLFSAEHVVVAHAALLERIIRNLLSNAIKYTDNGGVLLGCRKRAKSLVIEVWDTGCGIPQDKIDETFIRFVQVDESGWEKRPGYGIGLAIVKKFADSLNYNIEVFSKVGKGSVFRLTVPLAEKDDSIKVIEPTERAETEAIREKKQEAEKTDSLKTLPSFKSLRQDERKRLSVSAITEMDELDRVQVVLIDDDDTVREALKALLTQWEIAVVDFSEISSMCEYLKSENCSEIKLIISDYHLGETVTGLNAIEEARAILGDATPAFIVTGAESDDCWESINKAGVSSIRKPVKPARLRAMINHLLSS